MAVSFVSAGTAAHLRLIEKRQRMGVPREQVAGFEPARGGESSTGAAAPTGGIKSKRPSRKDKLREAAARLQMPQPKE